MKLHPILLLTSTMILALPQIAGAQISVKTAPAVHKKAAAAAVMYECTVCHHKATAAEAKKLHYRCPVDTGKLVPVKTASVAGK